MIVSPPLSSYLDTEEVGIFTPYILLEDKEPLSDEVVKVIKYIASALVK